MILSELEVNNFKNSEAPYLISLKAGEGQRFKKDVRGFVETLKREIPQLFESQEYLNRKKQVMEEYEESGKRFFKDLDKKVREEGFTLVDIQMGQIKRPEVVPLIDGKPTHIDQVEAMVEKGRYPKEEFEEMKKKQANLRAEIDQIFLELRDLQKGVQENLEKMDRLMFQKLAMEHAAPLTKQRAVWGLSFQARRPATMTTKPARMVYSRRRKAMAPEWMSAEISCIVSLPGDWRLTTR